MWSCTGSHYEVLLYVTAIERIPICAYCSLTDWLIAITSILNQIAIDEQLNGGRGIMRVELTTLEIRHLRAPSLHHPVSGKQHAMALGHDHHSSVMIRGCCWCSGGNGIQWRWANQLKTNPTKTIIHQPASRFSQRWKTKHKQRMTSNHEDVAVQS